MLKLDIPIKDWNGYTDKWSSIPDWQVRVSQLYGQNLLDYKQFGLNSHNGIDIAFREGCAIIAPCDMKITYIQIDPKGYGNAVWGEAILSDSKVYRYELCLAHFKEIVCEKGDIKRGELLGYGDSTGFSTGHHLHLGVREFINGKFNAYNKGWVDPKRFLPHLVWDWNDNKLMEKTDGKLVFNNDTGEIGYMYDKWLRTANTDDRFSKMLASYIVRKEGVNISGEAWNKLPKKSF